MLPVLRTAKSRVMKIQKRRTILVLASVFCALFFMLACDAKEPKPRAPLQFQVEPYTGLEFVWIPKGCYLKGHSEDEKDVLLQQVPQRFFDRHYAAEGSDREVCLEKGFWLSRTETPQHVWEQSMGQTDFCKEGDQRPADSVSLFDVTEFLDKITEKTPAQVSFRLPTEDEWEYACLAGGAAPFGFGDVMAPDLANYKTKYGWKDGPTAQYKGTSTPCGQYPESAFGLYDMHGNVMEWTASVDANKISGTGRAMHIAKGGHWNDAAQNIRCAARRFFTPRYRNCRLGFRLVMNAPPPDKTPGKER